MMGSMRRKNLSKRGLQSMSLPEWVASEVRRMVTLQMEPGQRIETEERLAKQFKVSLGTLRSGMEILEKEGLIVRRQGSGTYVSSAVDRPIAILVDQDISDWNFSYLYRRIMARLTRCFNDKSVPHRFYLGTREMHDGVGPLTCRSFMHDLQHNRLAGVINVVTPAHPGWVDEVLRREVPLVASWGAPYKVTPDLEDLMRRGVRELISQGCERIALVSWNQVRGIGELQFPEGRKFPSIVEECGLSPDHCPLLNHFHRAAGSGGRAIYQMEQEGYFGGKLDGLLFVDDIFFCEAMVGMLKLGLDIPGSMRVATATNRGASYHIPFPVTRLEFDGDQIGMLMADMILQVVAGESLVDPAVLVPCKIIRSDEAICSEVGGGVTSLS